MNASWFIMDPHKKSYILCGWAMHSKYCALLDWRITKVAYSLFLLFSLSEILMLDSKNIPSNYYFQAQIFICLTLVPPCIGELQYCDLSSRSFPWPPQNKWPFQSQVRQWLLFRTICWTWTSPDLGHLTTSGQDSLLIWEEGEDGRPTTSIPGRARRPR